MSKIYSQAILDELDFPIEDSEDFLALKQERKKIKKKLKKACHKGKHKKIKKLKKKNKKLKQRYKALQKAVALNNVSQQSSFDFGRLLNDCAPRLLDAIIEGYRLKNQSYSYAQTPEQCFTTKQK